ncbi:MAG: S8 family serine peptidase, partial [Anaerolineae bacterium]|nr:S8 family serine peptidase [Anaerolineae bacterium]
GVVTGFSSRGPADDGAGAIIKPDIIAPGYDIVSSLPDNHYAAFPGTSMAGPHVVGVVALLWSADPALIGNIERTEAIIRETAEPVTGPVVCGGGDTIPNNAYGYGRVDAFAAVEKALNER